MKKTPDLTATLAKGASEAREILEQTANLIDAEWQRLVATVESSNTVPDQVKQAMDRLDDAVGNARKEASTMTDEFSRDVGETVDDVVGFVNRTAPIVVESGRRAARQFGIPVPDAWPWGDDVNESDSADSADTVAPAVEPANEAKAEQAAKNVKKSTTAKAKSAKKTATTSAKKASVKAKSTTKATKAKAKSTKKATSTKAKSAKKTAAKSTKKATAKKTTRKPAKKSTAKKAAAKKANS